MNLARVVKKVVSTVKNSAFDGRPLLLVQPLDLNLAPKGSEILCIDFLGSNIGEVVLMIKEGSSVQQLLGNKQAPADSAIVGIVDSIDFDGKRVFEKYPAS